ncbi:CFA45 protein, partial [Polypterus senegalus]
MSINSSCQSGGSRSRRYRTRAHTSHVDETLFGTPKKLSDSEKIFSQDHGGSQSHGMSHSAPSRRRNTPKQETIKIVTKDLIRDLKVPRKDPSGMSIILSPLEFKRITSASRIRSAEEREAEMSAIRREKEAAIEASEDRKALLRQADFSRRKNEGPSDLEAEARERAQYLLEKANTQRLEQEDEIKKMNELILGAQCHAVQDAQILEKQQILNELQEEERRLDAMMEVERRKAIERQEQIEALRKEQRIIGKRQIIDQIKDRDEQRLLEEELKEQEGQEVLENLEKLQMEELQALEVKKREQRRLQLEILQINEESLRAKARKKEEERIADLMALEFTRKKMERDAEYEAEQERIKKEKEKEVARLRALQERERDHRAEQDALRARRSQEAAEREWRRKEKEQALKKAEEDERLRLARLEQVAHKEHVHAILAARERAEFERVIKAQQEEIARGREKEERLKKEQLTYSDMVRQQIREKEARTVKNRIEVFQEVEKMREEARNRQARLNEIKIKKLSELRNAGLPEKYCNEVERKNELPEPEQDNGGSTESVKEQEMKWSDLALQSLHENTPNPGS